MSDGPWKSLPLRRHWKQVAKQAENGAFSPRELSETLEVALWKDTKELPLDEVFRALVPDEQGVLFRPDSTGELEALRRDHPGSKGAQTFLTYLLDGEASGSSGHEMLESALADTLDECARDNSRAIEEHFYRRSGAPNVPVRRRLESAQRLCDFHALASQMLAHSNSSGSSPSPSRQSGLDDGPLL